MKARTDIIMDISLGDECRQFAEILGLDKPIPERVLKTALQNESYSRNLLLSRESPDMLNFLIRNPPQKTSGEKEPYNFELIGKAAAALLKWGKTGFSMVKPDVLIRRENACITCPNLREPQSLLQKIVPASDIQERTGYRTGKKVCSLCGCNVAKNAPAFESLPRPQS